MSENKEQVLLEVDDVCMYFDSGRRRVKASEHVSFEVNRGEIFGLVGESGSGKSTIGKCIIGLNKRTSGDIRFNGTSIHGAKGKSDGKVKKTDIQMIFQDPMSSLNPKMTVGEIIGEALDVSRICSSREEREEKIESILQKVGIPPEYKKRYPRQFSGGQRQRIGIARALVVEPELIIADECIAALDASVQAQIVNMLRDIKEETGTAFLFISHDLAMVRFLSDRIGVLHLGYLLEAGKASEVFEHPVHPYTRNLLETIPKLHPILQKRNDNPYNYHTSGIDYANGTWHDVSPEHRVWCSEQEFKKWSEL